MSLERLEVTAWPHIRSNDTVARTMLDVSLALVPAGIAAVLIFGYRALWITLLAVLTAVGTEAAVQRLQGKPVSTGDWSAALTGLLLAYNLPPQGAWWLPVIGSIIAVAIVKHAFGGLGHNFMNPALAARAILLTAWPSYMNRWLVPGYEAVTAATPLTLLKSAETMGAPLPPLWQAFVGTIGGTIGEVSALALLVGAAYLLYRRVISWRIPLTFLLTLGLLSWVFSENGWFAGNGLYHVFLGGAVLGAFFMATDYSSSPVTPLGQLIMGFGCGLLTFIIRRWGMYPEGVSFSILLMNVATPLIDRCTTPRVYGRPARRGIAGVPAKGR